MAARDAPALFTILGDEEAMAFWHRPRLPRLATVEALLADELAAMAQGGFHYWTMLKDEDAIGGIDLSYDDGTSAWAGFLLRKDQWGQGYGREALAAVTDYAFGPMGLNLLMAQVQRGNGRAVRLLQSLGFQEEGPLADVMREDGPRPTVRFSLNRSSKAQGA